MQAPLADWFTMDSGTPCLMGSRCGSCGAHYFPPQLLGCRDPDCRTPQLRRVPLSNTGVLWSFTVLRERPPPPFAGDEHFSSLPIVVVELVPERMKVLGYLSTQANLARLAIGMRMVLCLADGQAIDYRSLRWQPMEETGGQ